MAAENLRLIVGSVADPATLGATSEAMPVTHLQKPGREYFWRSTTTADQVITGTLPAAVAVDGFGLAQHNLGGGSSFRLILKLSSVVVYDSLAQSASVVIPAGVWRAGIDPYGASYDEQLRVRVSKWWFTPVFCDEFELTLSDALNTDGYLQVGRLFLGSSIQPKVNFSYGAQLQWVDNSTHIRTAGGGLRTEDGSRFRRLTIALGHLDDAERTIVEIDLGNVPKSYDLLIDAYPNQGGALELTHTFVGRRVSDVAVTHAYFPIWTSQLTFEEA